MSPHQRMIHHRDHSLPEMKRLRKMCSEKLEKKLVEPNSPLWEPLTFIINQWERLTKFCEVPGAPQDRVQHHGFAVPALRTRLRSHASRSQQEGADKKSYRSHDDASKLPPASKTLR